MTATGVASTASVDRGARTRARRRSGAVRAFLTGHLFILPGILGLGLLVVYPLVTSGYHAFTDWNGLTPAKWTGLKNFRYLLGHDPTFWPSVRATLLFVVITVPAMLAGGLALAVLVNRSLRGVRIFRTIFYLPVVLPSIAVMALWKYVYDPQYGLANQVLKTLHLPTSMWVGSTRMAMPAVVVVGLWGVGSTMMIFLAGLQAVPAELYEAAQVDGAGPIRTFFRITLPMLTPILLLQVVLQMNAAFQTFNQIAILTKGGPGTTTDVLMYKIYSDGFKNYLSTPQLGYATAEVWMLFLIVMVVTAITLRFSSIWVYAGEGDK
ncbi:carbohydrate ABC transporter permease [Actinoallomurus soli]|uniref:carbohydrate ABC transporter permease n=1 Tax=Actinoallomurus soli TaxID=2952535 RepID=UPI0020930DF1|nr:sugar ABC transporter permease [Actinoallomurus soli]MCO5970572.1 sugar ABC transporter permease [Actinoallomurus soli]